MDAARRTSVNIFCMAIAARRRASGSSVTKPASARKQATTSSGMVGSNDELSAARSLFSDVESSAV